MTAAALRSRLLERLGRDRYSIQEHGSYARGWNDAFSHILRIIQEEHVEQGLTELRRATSEPPHDVAWSDLAELGEGEG